jgi:hypothetical protein
VGQGLTVHIRVAVKNQLLNTQTFNVTAKVSNATHADEIYPSPIIVTLSPENSTILEFTWNAIAAKGEYTVSAVTTSATYEVSRINGTIIVSMVGDITGPTGWPDGKCDIRDIALVATYFGQDVPPAPANCDVTGPIPGVSDRKVDIRDIATVALHFGEVDP